MAQQCGAHEVIYNRTNPVSLMHTDRLRIIHEMFSKYASEAQIRWADFGCSNGFIINDILTTDKVRFSKIVGYDFEEDLLNQAVSRSIPNAEFKFFNLNQISTPTEQFDMVTCFETLEHVGNYENAFVNLFNCLADNGALFITVPNEIGFIGLIKFIGRMAVRKNAYGDFFIGQSRLKYLLLLLKNGYIDIYRKPNQLRFGPHLGFDYRKFEKFIDEQFIQRHKLSLVEKKFTIIKMNIAYIFKRA
jgi:2-polyprenyl-3-methyl-5-hydroxy-6-metoxy-1,4-benzoquinol methylase